MHEERKPGALLPGEAGNSLPLTATRDLPAKTCTEDLEVPPIAAGQCMDRELFYT